MSTGGPTAQSARKGARVTTEPKSPPPPAALGHNDAALHDQVGRLSSQLTELREEVERLSERSVYSTAITTLASPDYELLRDIPITVEEDGDETSVSWFEIGLMGVDDTPDGALISFENRLLRLFDDLNAMADDKLGPLPSRWKRTLATVIRHA